MSPVKEKVNLRNLDHLRICGNSSIRGSQTKNSNLVIHPYLDKDITPIVTRDSRNSSSVVKTLESKNASPFVMIPKLVETISTKQGILIIDNPDRMLQTN